ncbi:hypothetical protein FA15DRAFT_672160, partial [Coprinopsis marcescibilis]
MMSKTFIFVALSALASSLTSVAALPILDPEAGAILEARAGTIRCKNPNGCGGGGAKLPNISNFKINARLSGNQFKINSKPSRKPNANVRCRNPNGCGGGGALSWKNNRLGGPNSRGGNPAQYRN